MRQTKARLLLFWLVFGLLPAVEFGLGLADVVSPAGPVTPRMARQVFYVSGLILGFWALGTALGWVGRALAQSRVRNFCFALLPLALVVSVVEGAAGIYLRRQPDPGAKFTVDRLSLPMYEGMDWAKEVIASGRRIQYEYAPFRLWKAGPLTSTFMHVDADGNRATPDPLAQNGAKEFRVDVYGGSTVFCLETSDGWTLPACLARALAARLPDRKVVVRNLGVPSYVREQESIWLGLNLRTGPRPDLVIFYDGANDALISGWMGLPHKEPGRFRDVMRGEDPSLLGPFKSLVLGATNTGRMLGLMRPTVEGPEHGLDAAEIASRAKAAAERYTTLAEEIRRRLAPEEIRSAFFLQPVLYSKKYPTAWEESFLSYERNHRPGIETLNREFQRRVGETEATRPDGSYHELSGFFDERKEGVYFDIFHVGPRQNEELAAEMVRRLGPQLPPAN